ncbi:MAG: iron dicitrate transport regulator FecR, partial [Bacteroides cellulosilyticus]|nr:iron dicitrate transport regulator FecR [Bacteroides cellulosilyticus]
MKLIEGAKIAQFDEVPLSSQSKNTIKLIAIYGKLQIFVGYNLTTNKNSI